MRTIAVATRSLDPAGGGAERSLSSLLNGVAIPGPKYDPSLTFQPLINTIKNEGENLEPWAVSTCFAMNGEPTGLLKPEIQTHIINLPTESIFSGLAWRLRSRRSGQSHPRLFKYHLRNVNNHFSKKVEEWLDKMSEKPTLGITQLTWSAGAAEAFRRHEIPYLIFIRDDIPFRFPEVFRSAIEGAICVCTAGEGLGQQVAEKFMMQRNANIPLAIDYERRFIDLTHVRKWRQEGLENRSTLQSPRFTIVGVTPEKGFAAYERLLPYLQNHWPEAHFDIYGSGHYVERLGLHPNATNHGHVPINQAFAAADVHVIIGETAGTWGRVINEAGVFGIPTVTCGIGSQPEALGPGGVIVHNHHDILEFTSALRDCWTRREELGKRAFDHAGVTDHRRASSIFRTLLEDLTR
ncbi:MAG: Uncharacterised protein [Methanobacteriota archaeon]|nr:hypothetical protein [Euryarchaeota archaeon]CAI8176880.1 MAG: Uncharacterised protein [Euryarchaeota archaeon]